MPLYEYSCGACGAVSEINHRMSDPAPTDCPICGKPQLSKMISAAGFRLKGAGWYETDFKSDGKRNLAGDTASAAAEGAKTSETKSDAKPAAGGGDAAKPAPAKTETKTESKPAAAPASKPASPGGGTASSP